MNWREELCKDTASSAAFTESLVRPHDVHVYNNGFGGEFRFAKPIGKGPDFVMWVLKEEHLCQLNVSPVLPIDVAYMQQSSSYRSPVLKKENTCSCQPVATVRQPFSPQFPTFQKVRSMKRVYSPMLKAEKAWVLQTPQTLCEDDSLVSDAAVLRFPGILSIPGIMLPVPLPSKNEQGIEHLSPCRENTSTCASSMPCQSCQLMCAFMQQSSSYRSPVPKKGQTFLWEEP